MHDWCNDISGGLLNVLDESVVVCFWLYQYVKKSSYVDYTYRAVQWHLYIINNIGSACILCGSCPKVGVTTSISCMLSHFLRMIKPLPPIEYHFGVGQEVSSVKYECGSKIYYISLQNRNHVYGVILNGASVTSALGRSTAWSLEPIFRMTTKRAILIILPVQMKQRWCILVIITWKVIWRGMTSFFHSCWTD